MEHIVSREMKFDHPKAACPGCVWPKESHTCGKLMVSDKILMHPLEYTFTSFVCNVCGVPLDESGMLCSFGCPKDGGSRNLGDGSTVKITYKRKEIVLNMEVL